MNNPKISVIVPVYNVEKYIPRCIDSILAQTFTDFKLLLIDDGSQDLSGKICDEYAKKDNRIKVFHKENGGVSSARNAGLDNAQGEWIIFVDSDDWIEPCLVTNVIHIISENNVDLVCWNYFIDHNENCNPRGLIDEKLKVKKKEEVEQLLRMTIYPDYYKYINEPAYDMVPIWNKIYKKEILNNSNISFDVNLRRAEDALFNIKYLKKVSRVALSNQCLTHYVIRDSSAMHLCDIKLFSYLYNSLTAIKKNINLHDTIAIQCFKGRNIGYIYESFELYMQLRQSISQIEFKESFLKICEPMASLSVSTSFKKEYAYNNISN